MDKELKFELPEDTAKEFALAPGTPPVFEHFDHGKIDIRELTPERAKHLVESGVKEILAVSKENKPAKSNANA